MDVQIIIIFKTYSIIYINLKSKGFGSIMGRSANALYVWGFLGTMKSLCIARDGHIK
jgi:hypothetical protein